jgi:hypothetical protein
MSKPLWKTALLCFGLSLWFSQPPLWAAPAAAPRESYRSMTQARAVRLGLEKFMAVYSQREGGESTAGQVAGYGYYERSRRAANDKLSRRLGPVRRAQIAEARAALGDLGQAVALMKMQRAGGGTMYLVFVADASASREDFLAEMIATLAQRPLRRRVSRARSATLLRESRRLLNLFKQQGPADHGFGAATVAQQRNEYAKSWDQASAALGRLSRLAARLPDKAALEMAAHAHREMQRWDVERD